MIDGLTLEERATNADTQKHIRLVARCLHVCVVELLRRADAHDRSKLERPEVELFTEYTDKLATCTYGSSEYEVFRKAMGPALAHHYANNDHHPEHFKHGIDDMNLLQLLEMLCDWKASSTRHNDGNLRKSIEVNANRFGISPQLTRLLENTAAVLDGVA